MKAARLLPVLAAGWLAGCAPGNCDPSTAGFFDGVACQSSGAYNLRENRLQGNLAAARSNLQAERGQANAAAEDASQARTEQARAASALAAMGRENAALRARLDAASRREGANAALVRQRQAELAALERDRDAASRNGASPAQLSELQRRRRILLDAASEL